LVVEQNVAVRVSEPQVYVKNETYESNYEAPPVYNQAADVASR
jgi:hypothetical protein